MLLRRRTDYYRKAHPDPTGVFLVVEVADTSLAYDHAKLRIYAKTLVQEVWIVDRQGERVEVSRHSREDACAEFRAIERGQRLACGTFPAIELDVDDILE